MFEHALLRWFSYIFRANALRHSALYIFVVGIRSAALVILHLSRLGPCSLRSVDLPILELTLLFLRWRKVQFVFGTQVLLVIGGRLTAEVLLNSLVLVIQFAHDAPSYHHFGWLNYPFTERIVPWLPIGFLVVAIAASNTWSCTCTLFSHSQLILTG